MSKTKKIDPQPIQERDIKRQKKKIFVLKLGGGVFSYSNKRIDYNYLREFRDMLQEQVLLGRRFVVVIGGGQTCRDFQSHAKEEGGITEDRDLHWIGAAVNTLNAYMIRPFLGEEITEEKVWKFSEINSINIEDFQKQVIVVGGYKAGISSDAVALRVAQAIGALKIFDLKNIDGVYSEDPKINPEAKFISKLDWSEYLDLIGNPEKHEPGGNLPVDPVAAVQAKELGAEYYIIKASDFDSIEAAMNNEEFHGTYIN